MANRSGSVESVALTPQTMELRRAVLARLDDLASEFDVLIGKQSEMGRPVLYDALKSLRPYVEQRRREVNEAVQRATRPETLAFILRVFSENIARSTGLVQLWFSAPHSDDLPVALSEAIAATLKQLDVGLPDLRPLVTVGLPNQLESKIPDAEESIYGKKPAEEPSKDRYAVLTVPTHEGMSPLHWPIILGHELTHLRLRQSEREQSAADPNRSNLRLAYDDHYMLKRLDILSKFPLTKMKQVVAMEMQQGRTSLAPPGLGPVLTSDITRDIPDPSPSVSARIAVANSWVEEVLCDLVMVRRFGPAGLAAMANYLIATRNYSVQSLSHPPGVLRIQVMADYLADTPDGSLLRTVMAPWVAVDSTEVEAAQKEWAKLLCEYVRSSVRAIVDDVNRWPGERYDATSSERVRAVHLAHRQISWGLPPHEANPGHFAPDRDEPLLAETSPKDENTASVAPRSEDLINAAWSVVAAGIVGKDNDKRRRRADRLVLKALETEQLLSRIAAIPPDENPDIEENGSPPVPLSTESESATMASPDCPSTGGVLGRTAIEERLTTADQWRRLEVNPRLAGTIQRASIDLRLGTRFITFQRSGIAAFNAVKGTSPRTVQRSVERSWGIPFVLHPGEVVLAAALEYVALPADLSAQVITRSSYGRLGLITATAAQVHPLYRGCLTLELVNLGTVPLELYPGERVAQLVFLTVDVPKPLQPPTEEELFRTRYSCPTGPEFPEVTVDPWVISLARRNGPRES